MGATCSRGGGERRIYTKFDRKPPRKVENFKYVKFVATDKRLISDHMKEPFNNCTNYRQENMSHPVTCTPTSTHRSVNGGQRMVIQDAIKLGKPGPHKVRPCLSLAQQHSHVMVRLLPIEVTSGRNYPSSVFYVRIRLQGGIVHRLGVWFVFGRCQHRNWVKVLPVLTEVLVI
jgi:hypothetical protein